LRYHFIQVVLKRAGWDMAASRFSRDFSDPTSFQAGSADARWARFERLMQANAAVAQSGAAPDVAAAPVLAAPPTARPVAAAARRPVVGRGRLAGMAAGVAAGLLATAGALALIHPDGTAPTAVAPAAVAPVGGAAVRAAGPEVAQIAAAPAPRLPDRPVAAMPAAVGAVVAAAPEIPALVADATPFADNAPPEAARSEAARSEATRSEAVPSDAVPAAVGPAAAGRVLAAAPLPTPRPAAQAALAPAVSPAPQSAPWVVVHHGPATPAAEVERIAATLIENGFHHLSFRPVSQAPDAAQARFFHPRDRDAAEAVGRALGEAAGVATADFTHYAPAPEQGLVELWVAGRS
jgi:hypothetical protein